MFHFFQSRFDDFREEDFMRALNTFGAAVKAGASDNGPSEEEMMDSIRSMRLMFHHFKDQVADMSRANTNLLINYALARQDVLTREKQAIVAASKLYF